MRIKIIALSLLLSAILSMAENKESLKKENAPKAQTQKKMTVKEYFFLNGKPVIFRGGIVKNKFGNHKAFNKKILEVVPAFNNFMLIDGKLYKAPKSGLVFVEEQIDEDTIKLEKLTKEMTHLSASIAEHKKYVRENAKMINEIYSQVSNSTTIVYNNKGEKSEIHVVNEGLSVEQRRAINRLEREIRNWLKIIKKCSKRFSAASEEHKKTTEFLAQLDKKYNKYQGAKEKILKLYPEKKNPTKNIEQRLQKLNALFRKGLIGKDDYNKKKSEILAEL